MNLSANPAAGLPLIIHLKILLLFPDFSLIFYSFPYPLTDKKIVLILYFNGANCITSDLGLLSQERIYSPWEQILSFKSSLTMRREMGLDYFK